MAGPAISSYKNIQYAAVRLVDEGIVVVAAGNNGKDANARKSTDRSSTRKRAFVITSGPTLRTTCERRCVATTVRVADSQSLDMPGRGITTIVKA